ncbi:MAG TPA: ABC transporter permease subunit [Pirellulales bacterium]|nr:ABC transporter permease subunit [Pirellulales bacterium]
MPTSFTGRTRLRRTRWTVRAADILAHSLIVAGGIGTIVAVSMVCVFLVWSVLPMFEGGEIEHSYTIESPWTERPLELKVNEHGVAGWALLSNGTLDFFRLNRGSQGDLVSQQKLVPSGVLTSVSTPVAQEEMAFGCQDGTVRVGSISFRASYVSPSEWSGELLRLPVGEAAKVDHALVERAAENHFRRHELAVELDPPVEMAPAAIELLDLAERSNTKIVGSLAADGKLRLTTLKRIRGLKAGDGSYKVRTIELPQPARRPPGKPMALFISGVGDNLFVVWKDGSLVRYDLQSITKPRIAEEIDLLPDASQTVTAVSMLVGKATLVVGDSSGQVRGWFRVRRSTPDGGGEKAPATLALVDAHALDGPGAAVTSLAPSDRTRMLAVGYANGDVRVFYVTNDSLLVEANALEGQEASVLAMYPRDDALLVAGGRRTDVFRLDVPHPEVSLWSLFMPVWYEGYSEPSHEWQSSGGTDNFEPKLGMTKLVFGTFKATLYSLLIAVPLALLAAVYTSEFLHKRARARIKPTIELMASLPSVVLGFIGALILAPIVERNLPAILVGIATVPLTLLAGAFAWQTLPKSLRVRLNPWRFVAMSLSLPLGVWLAALLGRPMERLFFSGDIMLWLSGRTGNGVGGWMLLLLPMAALASAWILSTYINPLLRSHSAAWGDAHTAAVELLKFLVATVVCILLALALAWTLTAAGFDPRGTFVGTYEQLNALVVGIVMGFAVIPIIYTIAEDALSTVPEHLRSASLGAGATPWQTAVRIIIPTAMSGLFSAVMIGLGRAVGETMIVLMAAGNTPVLDWNVFNGFRTLSGNIAEELPEAVKDSTHYRTLFLAALVLFALTFILNTIAEQVRQRFRKRAFQL